ncbi:MAG: DUF4154 domain-containing protein [Acidobacteria bacterium]|nr:MAG: DUF4154 domain-containing protein [Acidobacteriota bacterium]
MAALDTPSNHVRGLGRLCGTLWSALAMGVLCCSAMAQQSLEYQVKAAFLLNFTKFIEWPTAAFDDEHSPIAICVLGDDPFGGALNQIVEGEAVNGRKIVVQTIRRLPPPGSCRVLFVSKSERDTRKLLTGLGPGVLTVGEGDGFLSDGGIIAFVIDNRRVRFDINQSAAAKASVIISSKLLNVARSVGK